MRGQRTASQSVAPRFLFMRRLARGLHFNPVVQRYAWPSELDLMARIAGLRLKERWDDWSRRPYTGTGSTVVSVYGR